MRTFLSIVTLLLLVILGICAVIYWITGTFYPISGVALVLFIILSTGIKKISPKERR